MYIYMYIYICVYIYMYIVVFDWNQNYFLSWIADVSDEVFLHTCQITREPVPPFYFFNQELHCNQFCT